MARSRPKYPPGWYAIRKEVIRRDDGLCQPCLKQGIRTPGSDVHHTISLRKGGTNELDNLVYICQPCHVLTRLAPQRAFYSRVLCQHGFRLIYPAKKKNQAPFLKGVCKDEECRKKSGIPLHILNKFSHV